MSSKRRMSFKEDAELAIGATGAALATDQVIKSIESDDDRMDHLIKAGVGAAVAIRAYEMLRRERERSASPTRDRRHSVSSSMHSRLSSKASNPPHHDRHILEEIISAYSLGKELLGDKHHHIRHLVGEAIGAAGLAQELGEREKQVVKEEKEEKRIHN
jgi:hypothetical protein